MARKRVYVAGPYTKGDCCINTRNALVVADRLMEMGYAPFVPHLSHFWHTFSPKSYDAWMAWCLEWVAASDVLLRLPGESKGADIEEQCAIRNNIPVVYSIAELIGGDHEQTAE